MGFFVRFGDPGVSKVILEEAVYPWESSASVGLRGALQRRLGSPVPALPWGPDDPRIPVLCGFTDRTVMPWAQLPDLRAAGTEASTHRPGLGRRLVAATLPLSACPASCPAPPHSQTRGCSCRPSALLCTLKSPHLHPGCSSAQHALPLMLLSCPLMSFKSAQVLSSLERAMFRPPSLGSQAQHLLSLPPLYTCCHPHAALGTGHTVWKLLGYLGIFPTRLEAH